MMPMATDPVLRLDRLGKSFGGLVVCDAVDLVVRPGEIHALIGPNGAGKTTLLNLITGLLEPDGGSLFFQGRNITSSSVPARARLGMARSFQISSLFPSFTVRENIELAVQASTGSSYRFWQRPDRDPAVFLPANELLATVGLAERSYLKAGEIAHGEQRLLEIGMALATRPALLILDEPMAGLGPASAGNMARLIKQLQERMAIILVEHDMDAVFSLADRISVLVQGQVIATGPGREIQANQMVQEAYLGTPCSL
jgi:branched-chain amino acid transport system ATP-binding protein